MGFAFVADAMEMMILSILGPALRCTDWRISKYDQASLTTVVFLGKFLLLYRLVTILINRSEMGYDSIVENEISGYKMNCH